MAVPDPNDIEAFMTEAGGPADGRPTGPELPQGAALADGPLIEYVDPRAGRVTIALVRPLLVDGSRIDQVTLRMPTFGEIEDLGRGTIASNGELLERLTGLDQATLRAMAWPDAEAVLSAFRRMVPDADSGRAA